MIAALWTACCALHSAMICEPVTRRLKQRLGDRFRYYRLVFNLVAAATFIPVGLYTASVAGDPVFRRDGPALLAIRYGLLACAVALFVAGGMHYSLGQFVGLSQLRRASSGGIARGGRIDSTGILALVRHPWYTATVLLVWAQDMDAVGLTVNAVLTVYVVVGTLLEEHKLVSEFGDAYRDYQRRVSMFLPFKWLSARVSG